jgi:hypothetical protein
MLSEVAHFGGWKSLQPLRSLPPQAKNQPAKADFVMVAAQCRDSGATLSRQTTFSNSLREH